MRTATSDDYLTTGIAYAFHPHRIPGIRAPLSGEFWIPIYRSNQGDRWRSTRTIGPTPYVQLRKLQLRGMEQDKPGHAAQHIKTDTRSSPRLWSRGLEHSQGDHQGGRDSGLFSAHLHSTVPNFSERRDSASISEPFISTMSRFPWRSQRGSSCTGTCMNDYLRGTNLAHVPQDLVAAYEPGPKPSPRASRIHNRRSGNSGRERTISTVRSGYW